MALEIPKLVMIGVGLIGGSLIQALRREHVIDQVVGVGRGEANLRRAVELGVVDHWTHDAASAVVDADLIVLATPVYAMAPLLEIITPHLKPDAVVTDVGSVKGGVVSDAQRIMGDRFQQFVPAHPIAGTENSGVDAAFAELFERHKVIMTPHEQTAQWAVALVRQIWELTGAKVIEMPVDQHDRVLSMTSHVPHVIAYALVDLLAESEDQAQCFEAIAGGFYDLTRVASSDPVMWRDISLMNRDNVVDQLSDYIAKLTEIRSLIANAEGEDLHNIYQRAKAARATIKRHL